MKRSAARTARFGGFLIAFLLAFGQILMSVPVAMASESNATFIKIAGGNEHSLALRSDGTVWAWGSNTRGELGIGTMSSGALTPPTQVHGPDDVGFLTDVIDIEGGGSYDWSIAVKSDGSVWVWGDGGYGEAGNGSTVYAQSTPTAVSSLSSDVIAVAAGAHHALALKDDGTVWAWGYNGNGQVGNGTTTDQYTPVDVGLSNVVAIAAGSNFSMALLSNGSVKTWGIGSVGTLGNGANSSSSVPVTVSSLSDAKAIAAGHLHSLALKSDGSVVSWGYNAEGQLGDGGTSNSNVPIAVSGLSNVIGIASGGATAHASYALKNDGSVHAWGGNWFGEIGDGTLDQRLTPTEILSSGSGVTSLAAGAFHGLALKSDGSMLAWGNNESGQLGDGTNVNSLAPIPVDAGTMLCHGLVDFSGGNDHSLSLTADGTVKAFGFNYNFQLGRNDHGTDDYYGHTPEQVAGISDVAAISTGAWHSVALKSDGTVWAWGDNDTFGELGNGAGPDSETPTQVAGLTDVTAIDAGGFATLALKSNGTVWAWGANTYGQLGDNSTSSSSTPIQVHGPSNIGFLSGITAIAAGSGNSYALKYDGTVWAWGYNSSGQLGDGSTTQRNVPVQVSGLTNVVAIAAADNHALALKSDGAVWAWGYNAQGQLGDGTTIQRSAPIQVHGPSNVGYVSGINAIAASANNSFFLKSDGTVWGAGYGYFVGDGGPTDRQWPVQLTNLSDISRLESGGNQSFAVQSDGTAWAWGDNNAGQLAVGVSGDRYTPVQTALCGEPMAITDLSAISGNGDVSLTWTEPYDAGLPITGYEVHYSTDGFSSDDQVCDDESCTDTVVGATVPGLENGTEYSFKVMAENEAGVADDSNVVTSTPGPMIPADLVIGQPDFTSSTAATGQSNLSYPGAIAYDPDDSLLFVADQANRIAVFDLSSGITNDMDASYLIGAGNFDDAGPYTVTQNAFGGVIGMAFDATNDLLFVADYGFNRVLVFDASLANLEANPFGMDAVYVLGQDDVGILEYDNADFFDDADPGLSQTRMNYPNGVAIDSANQHLFVADTGNNRVLVYDLSEGITNGMPAAYVLGQDDVGILEYDNADFFDDADTGLSQTRMNYPQGVAYDEDDGYLLVADSGNSRVLVYDLSEGISNGMPAAYVLGQADDEPGITEYFNDNYFDDGNASLSQTRMNWPKTVAYGSGQIAVGDAGNYRILIYDLSGGISNGMPAEMQIGQTSFTESPVGGTSQYRLQVSTYANPALAYDADGRLFVADTGNSRVMVYFNPAPSSGGGSSAPPADTTPPVISGISAANISPSSASITWSTDEAATSQVHYGPSTAYGNSTDIDYAFVRSHAVQLSDLVDGTTYHYQVCSRDSASNHTCSADQTFVTLAAGEVPADDGDDSGASSDEDGESTDSAGFSSGPNFTANGRVVSGSSFDDAVRVYDVTSDSVTISWTTDIASGTHVEYGTGIPYDHDQSIDGLVTNHVIRLTNLAPGTTYHFRVASQDASAMRRVSGDLTFATNP